MPDEPQCFSITVDLTGKHHVVRLRGELDLAGAGVAEETLVRVAGSTVVADLADLTFIDGQGISALLRAKHRLDAHGHRLILRNVRPAVRRTMELAGTAAALFTPQDPQRRADPAPRSAAWLPAGVVQRIEGAAWFKTTSRPLLVVDTALRINTVNAAYERVTGRPAASLVGELLFEAFPNNPHDPHDGVANLSASLEEVLRHGVRHWMGVQRYDVPGAAKRGFVYKEWVPVNTPLLHADRVVGAIHHVEDVTAVVAEDGGRARVEITLSARSLALRFPTLGYQQVLGVLAESHRDVADSTGAPDSRRAADVAAERLEMLTGHSPTGRPRWGE